MMMIIIIVVIIIIIVIIIIKIIITKINMRTILRTLPTLHLRLVGGGENLEGGRLSKAGHSCPGKAGDTLK